MNFNHTESRRMLSDSINRVIKENYDISISRNQTFNEYGKNSNFYAQLAYLGAIGALFPESVDGFGGEGFDVQVVFESLGRGLVVEPFLDVLMVGRALVAYGKDSQKSILKDLIAGSKTAAFAHYEPENSHDLSNVNLTARKQPDAWLLNGTKCAVAFGGTTDFLLVSARTVDSFIDEQGISLFLLPRHTHGVSARSNRRIDGGIISEILFENVKLSTDSVVGELGYGYSVLEDIAGWGTLALCAEALGIMQIIKDSTLDYLRTRKQFGVPIGSFQALQHRMVELLIEFEQAHSAVVNLAAAISSSDRVIRERAVSSAKFSIGRIGKILSEESIQIHGGIGMTWELPLSHYAKRLIMIDHQLGDEDYHIARYLELEL